ncbi:MAG: PDZ domain-containing protein [Sphingomonas sp.]|nr:PDZ domain-containing protein [Sphingomonas sp.]
MKRSPLDRLANGGTLVALALGALTMSLAFFVHLDRRGAAPHTQILPGLTLANSQPADDGLIVTSIRSDSPAAQQGIIVGDDIVALDGNPVHSLDQANRYLLVSRQQRVVLELIHENRMRQVTLDRSGT